MHERSLVNVKVEPRSTSRLISSLLSCLYFIYVIKVYVQIKLICVAKNVSVEIKPLLQKALATAFNISMLAEMQASL